MTETECAPDAIAAERQRELDADGPGPITAEDIDVEAVVAELEEMDNGV